MRRSWKRAAWVAAVSLPLFGGVAARAQAPVAPAAPQTLWSWLGVPKPPMGGVINRQGNFPGCEKLPPLKKIADPANLASKNPAIKKAAEIKAEEDLAKQKIKAIKYLAEIGCGGCYPGVAEALAASLDDCTEEVRYEAVKAILSTSACGQDDCTKSSTCSAASRGRTEPRSSPSSASAGSAGRTTSASPRSAAAAAAATAVAATRKSSTSSPRWPTSGTIAAAGRNPAPASGRWRPRRCGPAGTTSGPTPTPRCRRPRKFP
jgi:hypothetical protein